MSEIFISYANEDEGMAKQIAEALESYGWSVWWDHRIPPGKDYASVIEAALKKAKCIIVLWSKASTKSRWVQNEAAEGAEKGTLVPALIDEVEIPFEFRRIQAADLINWQPVDSHEQFNFFVESISTIMKAPPPNPAPKKSKQYSSSTSKKTASKPPILQRHKGYLAGSVFCALTGFISLGDGMSFGDVEMLMSGVFFLGLAIFLWSKA